MDLQRYIDAPLDVYEELFRSDDWWMEQKVDGMRLAIHITPGLIEFKTLGDVPLKSTAATQWYEKLTEELSFLRDTLQFDGHHIVLDGEILIEDGTFLAFDMPSFYYADGGVEPLDTYFVRRAAFEELSQASECFQVVPVARTEAEKRALWLMVNQGGQEGVVAKNVHAEYRPGERTDQVMKMKITHTIDCVILERNEGDATNAVLGLLDGSTWVKVGRSSMIGREHMQVGQVVEVTYATIRNPEAPSLLMPRVKRLRDDKPAGRCTIDQIEGTFGSKELIAW